MKMTEAERKLLNAVANAAWYIDALPSKIRHNTEESRIAVWAEWEAERKAKAAAETPKVSIGYRAGYAVASGDFKKVIPGAPSYNGLEGYGEMIKIGADLLAEWRALPEPKPSLAAYAEAERRKDHCAGLSPEHADRLRAEIAAKRLPPFHHTEIQKACDEAEEARAKYRLGVGRITAIRTAAEQTTFDNLAKRREALKLEIYAVTESLLDLTAGRFGLKRFIRTSQTFPETDFDLRKRLLNHLALA